MRRFTYKEAKGIIFRGYKSRGWGGVFKLLGVTVKLDPTFVGPEAVKQSLENLVDVLTDEIT